MRHHAGTHGVPLAPGDGMPNRSAWQTLRSLLPYIWPKDDRVAKLRVLVAFGCLILAKVATVLVPIAYARAVDVIAPKDGRAIVAVPLALIIGYGLLRLASAGMQSVLRLAVFNVIPTILELAMVAAVMWGLFDWRYAVITLLAVTSYIAFTAGFAAFRVKVRREMNDIDNESRTKALDSLLNYETVKYFGNEAHEARRFDNAQARYERAAVKVQVTLNMLNLGQAAIISAALAGMMVMAAQGVQDG